MQIVKIEKMNKNKIKIFLSNESSFVMLEKDFKKFIEDISIRSNIDVDVIEKDY